MITILIPLGDCYTSYVSFIENLFKKMEDKGTRDGGLTSSTQAFAQCQKLVPVSK